MARVKTALILATSPGASEVVGGLPLALRAVLALSAAGVTEIVLVPGAQARALEKALARRQVAARVRWLATAEDARDLAGPAPALVLAGNVLVGGEALAPLLSEAGPDTFRLASAHGSRPGEVHAALCPGAAIPALLAALGGGTRALGEAIRRVGTPDSPVLSLGTDLFIPLDSDHPRAVLETALLDHLGRHTSAGDSYLASLIDRRLSRPVTRLLVRWPVSPSQITLVSILLGLAGAASLASVSYAGRLGGLLALVASIVLDCVDGEVARARFEQSAAGARLDVMGDYAVHLATFTGLGVGLARQGLPPTGVWAVVALVGGVVAAMAAVHALFVRPALARGGDLHWSGDAKSLRGTPVATIVEKLASRDYTYLLLVFALMGHLEWFLYAAAAGSWAFVTVLIGYWAVRLPARGRQAASR